jgi:hypothetical protein
VPELSPSLLGLAPSGPIVQRPAATVRPRRGSQHRAVNEYRYEA